MYCTTCPLRAVIFTIQPEPLTALNKTVLRFECAAENANLYQWFINDTDEYLYTYVSDIDSTINTAEENGNWSSTLTVFPPYPLEQLTNVYVHCEALNVNPGSVDYNVSQKVLLQIQGTVLICVW